MGEAARVVRKRPNSGMNATSMSAETTLTKTFEFSSSHRYFRAEWTQEENERVFGACARPNGHGHNYLLDVTVKGPVDPVTGMVINIVDVKAVVEDVLEEFDHHHLNYDMPYFEDRVPTTENLAATLWELIAPRLPAGSALAGVLLREDEDLAVEYRGGA